VADTVRYYLTLSYQDDASARRLTQRKGVCAGEGATRLAEEPLLDFKPVFGSGGEKDPDAEESGDYLVGRDVVLASVQVRDCKLTDAPSLVERRDARPGNQPYVAAGTTTGTTWSLWFEKPEVPDSILGLETSVDTSTGRFAATPTYLVQILGERIYSYSATGGIFFEGWVQVHQPTSTGFTCRLFMPEHTVGTWKLNPHSELAKSDVRAKLVSQLRWHVTWTGVEG
jgi:hypothetical protein